MNLGLNTNVTHDGVGYHVQTEDLGQANPYVLTLVFRGGAIVAREKINYQKVLGDRPGDAQVKTLMGQQHARIIGRVKAGEIPAPAVAPDQARRPLPPGSSLNPLALPPADRQLDDIIAAYLRCRRS
jgi:hypothetical protein